MHSLKNRLLLGLGVITAVGMVVASVTVYGFTRSALYSAFDDALLVKARSLMAFTEETPDGIQLDVADVDFKQYRRSDDPDYYQMWLDNGSVLRRSERLEQGDLAKPMSAVGADLRTVELPDGRRGRQIGFEFHPKYDPDDDSDEDPEGAEPDLELSESSITIVVASGTESIESTLATLRNVLISVGAGAVALSVVLLVTVVRHSLRPLNQVAVDIQNIDPNNLQRRIDPRGAPAEVAPIIDRLNELLGQLESAFRRERAFSSDIAHELRTPIAGLRSTIEVSLTRKRSSDRYREALEQCLEICVQSQDTVENLLALSRAESGRVSVHPETIQIEDELRRCWDAFADGAKAKRLSDHWQCTEQLGVCTDREKLRVVLRNILDNAVSHSEVGGDVYISARTRNGSVEVQVDNSGNTLSADQVPHVFERFWQGDSARATTGQHSGLGMALSKEITRVLGGSIDVDVDGEVFRTTFSLPR